MRRPADKGQRILADVPTRYREVLERRAAMVPRWDWYHRVIYIAMIACAKGIEEAMRVEVDVLLGPVPDEPVRYQFTDRDGIRFDLDWPTVAGVLSVEPVVLNGVSYDVEPIPPALVDRTGCVLLEWDGTVFRAVAP